MGRNHFVMDTKGYCLFCLKMPKTSNISNPVESQVINGDSKRDNDISPSIFSLQRFSHYMRLNRKKILNDVVSASPTSLPVLEKSELKGVLCVECSKLTQTISDIALELEILQMTLDSCLFKIHKKINGMGKDMKLKEAFKREMQNNPQTLLHFGIVEQFQNEVAKKCSSLIKKAQPRVSLKRCDASGPVSPCRSLPVRDFRKTVTSASTVSERAEGPELCESTPPIILSVQGSHQSDVTGNGSIKTGHPPQPETPMAADPLSDILERIMAAMAPPSTNPSATDPNVARSASRQCRFCPRTFQRHWQARDHERAIHQGIKFSCGYCPATFVLRSSMHRHRKLSHKSGRRPFKVEVEPSTSTPPSSHFQDEDTNAIPENIEPAPLITSPACRTCHKTFKTEDIRRQHEKIHSGIQYSCDICSAQFTRRSNMLEHKRRVHKQIIRERVGNGNANVMYANAAMTSQSEMDKVSDNPLPETNKKNDFLLKASSSPGAAVPATSTPPPEPLKTAPSTSSAQLHSQDLKPSWPKTFTSNSVRLKHAKMHNLGRRPKVGPLQFKIGSSERIELKNEETDHLSNFLPEDEHDQVEDNQAGGESESDSCQCQHCHKIFKSLSSLRQHLTMVHNLRENERKHECEFCGKRFLKNYILLEHQRNVHLGTGKRYRCQLCSREFNQVGTRNRHMKNSCPNRPI